MNPRHRCKGELQSHAACRPRICIRSRNRAVDRAVIGSYCRLANGASSKRVSITAARSTEGAIPVSKAKPNITGIAAIAFHRRFPGSRSTNSTKNTMCIPDTAVIWLSPVRDRALRKA